MKNRCDGCGAKVQTIDPLKKGYIKSEVYLKNPDNFYCERCFNLIHYNKNVQIAFDEKDFLNNIKQIAESQSLVVHIVDIFDLNETIIANINHYFPTNPILLVANKFDLFLDSVRVMRVKKYLDEYCLSNQIHVAKSLVISCFKKEDIKMLIHTIEDLQDEKDVYLFGMTNVGKSSIVNAISEYFNQEKRITVSNFVGTTMDFIKVSLPNHTFLIDTPGIMNNHQVTYYLEKETLNLLTPKKYIRPLAYQLNPEQALFIGGFCIIKFLSGSKSSFVVNVPQGIVVHRTKLENAERFYNEHRDDILKIPNEMERNRMGNFISHFYTFDDNKKDLYISGLGFIGLIGFGKIEVISFANISVGLRDAIV